MNKAEREAYGRKVAEAANDPARCETIARMLAAVETLVCGRPGSAATADEPIFLAGFRLTPCELDVLTVATGRDGRDCVYLAFDVDDVLAAPAIAVLRPRGETVTIDPACLPWIASGARRAVLVPTGADEGCFAFRSGERLLHSANRPANDIAAGARRAAARLRAAVADAASAREAEAHSTRCFTICVAPGILEHRSMRLAA